MIIQIIGLEGFDFHDQFHQRPNQTAPISFNFVCLMSSAFTLCILTFDLAEVRWVNKVWL
jgi:hypothetical protein